MSSFAIPKGWTKGEPIRWTPVKNGSMWRISRRADPPRVNGDPTPKDERDATIATMVEIVRDELTAFLHWWSA